LLPGALPGIFSQVAEEPMSSQPLMSLNDFLSGPSKMRMPIYQRQYSWEIRQLEDLWNDLAYLEPGKRYYFGTVLLKRTGEEERAGLRPCEVFEIIDGQQRIASVLILLRAILEELKGTAAWASQPEEIANIESSYLKYADLYKLQLLGGDDQVFRHLIGESDPLPSPATASQKRLLIAKSFFKEKLLEQKKILDETSYAKFLEEVMKKALRLEIMKHIVDSDEEAVLIFETVNDRGMTLSTLDKTKSFLMHYLYLSGGVAEGRENLQKVNDIFASIFAYLEKIDRRIRGQVRSPKEFESDVQRVHYIIFKAGSTYFSDAFSSLKDQLISMYRDNAMRESGACTAYASEYASSLGTAFSAVCSMFLYDEERDPLKDSLDRVFGLSYATILPILISGWIRLDKANLIALLKNLECLEFRYNSFRARRSYTLSERLNTRAYDLYNGREDLKSILSSLQYLIKRYASDGAFRADLESENFYYGSKAAMKLLFYEYEGSLRSQAGKQMDLPLSLWLSDNYQVDHIWAQAALSEGLDYQEYLRCGNKLGNLAVVPRQLNISLANSNFSHKKSPYKESALLMLAEVADASHWREKQINERTAKITTFALKRWEIPK
jgi:hypothetical protein